MADQNTACQELADILRGDGNFKYNVCHVSNRRENIIVQIMGTQTHALDNMFSFDQIPGTDKFLCLGEVVLLENEAPYVVTSLCNQGITVSAIHNHWLNDRPHLIYVHFEAVMNAYDFARKVAYILSYIE